MLKGRRIASGITLKVTGSKQDQDRAVAEGIMSILEDAGAQFLANRCGICAGYGDDRLAEDSVPVLDGPEFQRTDGRAWLAGLSGLALYRGSLCGCR